MSAAGAGAAAAAAAANATKAMGSIVKVSPQVFEAVAHRVGDPLVVHATGGVFTRHHKYLTSYKGLTFFTKSDRALTFTAKTELLEAEKIWVPE